MVHRTETGREYSQQLSWEASGSWHVGRALHSLLARLGSEDVHVPFLSGSYFFSHPGPFTFFAVRMILEATFALLLVKQLVQPK